MMASIRGKDTRPEMLVRRYLHRQGFRYRLHAGSLPGKPDLVFTRFGVVVFIHGCFWHRHVDCKYASTPASNDQFWIKKFEGNVRRDREAIAALTKSGWRVILLWECGLRNKNAEKRLVWLPEAIRSGRRKHVTWPRQPVIRMDKSTPDE